MRKLFYLALWLALPACAQLTTVTTTGTQTLTNKTLTAPTINGGTHTAITGLGIRSTGAAFDLTLANTEVLTAGRTLTIDLGNSARTLTIGASASVSGTNTGDQTSVSGNAGTATALATTRAIYGNNFDGTAALTQIIASTFGGTGNGFTKFTGPTTAERTFTLPDADATILYSGGALGTPASGTATNLTGTAASLTAGSVTTNANLTGDVTSSGNATTLATVNSNVGSFTNSSITVNAKGLVTAASSGAAGATLGANTFTDTQTITKAAIGATSTDGAVLQNTTAAAAGAQQWSPRLRLTGRGWKTTATAASQAVDWIAETVPVQGTTAPTSNLVFSSSINGGAYTARVTVASGGGVTVSDGTQVLWSGGQAPGFTYNSALDASAMSFNMNNAVRFILKAGNLLLGSGLNLQWSPNAAPASTDTPDLYIIRSAAATLQQGAANAASPVAQVLQAQGSRSGTDTNVAGANYTVRPGAGTGTATPASLILATYVPVASGTGAQTSTAALTLSNSLTLGSHIVTPASSGTRYLCISTTGVVTSSASACSGT